MRAFLRTVTGSPRPSSSSSSPSSGKGKGKGKAGASQYSVADVAKAWNNARNTLERSGDPAAVPPKDSKQKEGENLLFLNRNVDVLVDALASEASTYALDDSTGPCLEYLLTNDVLASLVTLSLQDKPVGVLGSVIKSFDTLVVLLGDDFVALASRSLSKLLKGCFDLPSDIGPDGSSLLSPSMQRAPSSNYRADLYAAHLSSLLCGVCSRIKAHPDLLPIFFHDKRIAAAAKSRVGTPTRTTLEVLRSPTPSNRSSSTSDSASPSSASSTSLVQADSSASTSIAPPLSADTTTKLAQSYELPLLAYLLKYIHQEGRTGEFARAGVLFLVDLATADPARTSREDSASKRKSKRRTMIVEEALRPSTTSAISNRPSMGRSLSSSQTLPSAIKATDVPLRSILAAYIAQSDLADVLGAGLGALYGLLPSKVHIPSKPFSLGSSSNNENDTLSPSIALNHGNDNVFDASAQEMTDQEERLQDLRSEGYAIMGDPEFVGQMEGWSRLLEFGQDLVRRATRTRKEGTELGERILTSIRTAFLQNTLYPSILESSTHDGSGVAILVYLEATLTVLESEGGLSDCILTFLLGLETTSTTASTSAPSAADVFSPPLSPTLSTASSARPAQGRKKSRIGMITLDSSIDSHTVPSSTEAAFRFTLKDLLLQNLSHSSTSDDSDTVNYTSSSSLLALRLLHFMLTKFDYLAIELLDIVPDLTATKFPFDVALWEEEEAATDAENGKGAQEEEEEEFVYPTDDDESFTYPSPSATPKLLPTSPASKNKGHQGPSELELLLRLVPSSEEVLPSPTTPTMARSARSSSTSISSAPIRVPSSSSATFSGGSSSTSYSSYLEDAETAISQDMSFRRGVGIASAFDTGAPEAETAELLSPASASMSSGRTANASFESHSSATSIAVSTFSTMSRIDRTFDPMIPHHLSPDLPLMKHLLRHFADFFVNPPDLNLVITALISKLASCPYRSPQDWLVPKESPLRRLGEAGLLPFSLDDGTAAKGSDRPFEVFQSTLSIPKTKHNGSLPIGDAAVFGILTQLLGQVERYRREIRSFDRYLKERREGLLFVEDLAEAIGEGGLEESLANQGLPRPLVARSASSSFAGMTSTSTPTRVKKGSKNSVFARQGAEETKAALSPYASHYTQTSEIQVRAWVVPLPGEEGSGGISKTWTTSTVSSGISDIGQETPTKAVFTRQKDQRAPMQRSQIERKEMTISLSVLLDNVIILEEAVKELVALVAVRKSLGIDSV